VRVLFVCDSGDGMLDTAMRAQSVGHKVKMFLRKFDPRTRPIGKGLVELIPNWRAAMEWSDLVLLESNGVYMAEMDHWRARGCKIIGGNVASAEWEIEWVVGMDVFKKAGIAVPPYREFNDYAAAIAFVKRRDEAFVSKPCGAVEDKSLSYVAKTPADLCYMLGRWKKKHGGKPPCPFILQEKIEGIEFAVGAWFGPAGFSDDGWEENFETKKLFPGDLGPNTGETGTTMRYVRSSKLASKVLSPIEPQLEKLGYVGNVDVNCIIGEDGTPWPLEFTMRFGWPAWNIETALFGKNDPIHFLYDLASGDSTRGYHSINTVAVGVVLMIPPYPGPIKDYDDVVGIPIYGVADDLGAFHPCEMQNGVAVGTALATAGDYVGVVTGFGESVSSAARSAYKDLKSLHMPASPFYRVDIGQKLKRQLPALHEHGYARGLEY
jgi:phosphoribosylamine---glycine ligase